MKYVFLVLAFYLSASSLNAQQWLDKKYAYDSSLNVTYGTAINFNGGIDTLKMDIYSPICDDPGQISTKPLMIWIHGGAFLAGDKSEVGVTNLCKQFARRGYVTASINYRIGFISDDVNWTCNYPNYSCVFASDSAEWYRAYYRGVQDAKGALRYLINRSTLYRIDASNVFVAGESAGACLALGASLLDTLIEKPVQTNAIADAPKPNIYTQNCPYNAGKTFAGATIPRPDLGGIDGSIEPTTMAYNIKGIGNMYGAMFADLLKFHSGAAPKPAIFSFHQPCDLVVPIDSGRIYEGLNWCLTNGYNCYGIAHTAKVYGSRAFSNWNTSNAYGYNIHNEFTNTNFPYNFLFGPGSCADQVNNPCHAYDNVQLRENNLAAFFAPLVSTFPVCDTGTIPTGIGQSNKIDGYKIYPQPAGDVLCIESDKLEGKYFRILNTLGSTVLEKTILLDKVIRISIGHLQPGLYFLLIQDEEHAVHISKMVKE